MQLTNSYSITSKWAGDL